MQIFEFCHRMQTTSWVLALQGRGKLIRHRLIISGLVTLKSAAENRNEGGSGLWPRLREGDGCLVPPLGGPVAGAGPGLFLGKPRECAFPPARGGSALPEPNL